MPDDVPCQEICNQQSNRNPLGLALPASQHQLHCIGPDILHHLREGSHSDRLSRAGIPGDNDDWSGAHVMELGINLLQDVSLPLDSMQSVKLLLDNGCLCRVLHALVHRWNDVILEPHLRTASQSACCLQAQQDWTGIHQGNLQRKDHSMCTAYNSSKR